MFVCLFIYLLVCLFAPRQVRGKEVKRDEKFEVCVSEDGLTYTLKIKGVKASDAGDYEVSLGDLQATVPLVIDRKLHPE